MRNPPLPLILLPALAVGIIYADTIHPLPLAPLLLCLALAPLFPLGQRIAIPLLAGLIGGGLLLPAPVVKPTGPANLREAACLTRRIEGRVEKTGLSRRGCRILLKTERVELIRGGAFPLRGRLLIFLPKGIRPPLRGERLCISGDSRALPYRPDPLAPSLIIYRPTSWTRLPESSPLHRLLNSIRHELRRLFSRAGKEGGPCLRAIFLGEKLGMKKERIRAFRRTGIAHALAVSGFHVALLAGILSLCTARLARRKAILIELAVLTLYALLTGATPSILRATLLFAGHRLLPGRHNGTSLAACACLFVLVEPGMLHSLPAQLSFTACAGILLLARPLSDLPLIRRLPRPIRLPLAASLAAQLALTPLLGANFGQISLIAPLANLLLLPIFLLYCVSAPIACLLQATLGWDAPLVLSGGLFDGFRLLANTAAALPWAALEIKSWPALLTPLWFVGLLTLPLFKALLQRRKTSRIARELRATLPHGVLALGREDGYIFSNKPTTQEPSFDREPAQHPPMHRGYPLPPPPPGVPETKRDAGAARSGTEFFGQQGYFGKDRPPCRDLPG